MGATRLGAVVRHARTVAGAGSEGGQADGNLLQAFLVGNDQAAFATVVHRHGPMVLRLCFRVLEDRQAAEDAFQATFLVLAQRAASIHKKDSLASWLHGVALRMATSAKRTRSRRRKHEQQADPRCPQPDPACSAAWREIQGVLDEEIEALPEIYREPFILCCLEHASCAEVARRLRVEEGAVRNRLTRARKRLQRQLSRRGVTLTATLAALALSNASASTALADALVCSTAKAAVGLAAGHGFTTGLVSEKVATLVEGMHKGMVLAKLKVAAFLFLISAIACAGLGLADRHPVSADPAKNPAAAKKAARPAEPAAADFHGDPLPRHAAARLGTERFRSDSWVSKAVAVPGGKEILGLGSRAVILWDAATGREVRRFAASAWRKAPDGSTYSVRIESFALSPDGKTLAVGTADGSERTCPILLFDLATGRKVREWSAHKGNRFSTNPLLAFVTPTLVASAGADGSARVWDLAAKRPPRGDPPPALDLERSEKAIVSALVPSPDCKSVFGAGSDGKGIFWAAWEVATGKVLHRETGLPGTFVQLALAPDGTSLAVSLGVGQAQKEGGYNELRVYSAPKWTEAKRWRTHQGMYPQRNAVAFAPGGKTVATGGADQKVRRWDVTTGKAIGPAIEPYKYANNVAYLDAGTLMTFGAQNAVKLWDATTGKPRLAFTGSEAHLTTLAYSPDGRHLAAGGGGGDATVRVWEVATGKQVAHLRAGMAVVTCVRFSPDGKQVVSADSHGVARLWDWAEGGTPVRTFRDHKAWLHALALCPDGKKLATGDDAGVVRVWDRKNGKLLQTFHGHSAHVSTLAFSLNGQTLFSGGWDHGVRAWDLVTGKETWAGRGGQDPAGRRKPGGHTCPIAALAVSPSGNWLYSGSIDHTVCVWEAGSGRLCQLLPASKWGATRLSALSLSPDGTRLATALGDEGQESSVHLWDVRTGKKIAALPGHRGAVTGLSFSPDGRHIASGSVDTTVLLWDLPGVPRAGKGLDVKALTRLWDDLGSDDPALSYLACCRGAAAGDAAVRELKTRLKPIGTVDVEKVGRWVQQLDSDVFAERERASRALIALGLAAEVPLQKSLERAKSAEVRSRVGRILRPLRAAHRPAGHAVEVLTMIGTPDAKRLLAELASGASSARLTREAAAALERLRKRP